MTWLFAALFSLFTPDSPLPEVSSQTNDPSCYVSNERVTGSPSKIINICGEEAPPPY